MKIEMIGIRQIFQDTRAKITAGITKVVTKHERLAEFAINNAPALVVAAAMVPLAGISVAMMGICYTRPERLAGMIRDKNLPDTITTDITKPLADKIAVPFGNKFKDLIEKMSQDKSDKRINDPIKLSSPEVNDIAIEDVLFDMLGEMNSTGLILEAETFGKEYETRLAQAMKDAYFSQEPITVDQIKDLIKGIKIARGKNLTELLTEWIEENAIFGSSFGFGFGFGSEDQAHIEGK